MPEEARANKRPLVAHFSVALCIAAVLGVWALSSPPGASPDDEFHLPSIWCATGFSEGICEQSATPGMIRVPQLFALGASTKPCFVFHPDTSGACLFSGDVNALADHPAERVNSGLYPPIYYGIQRLVVTRHAVASATAIRLLNSTLVAGLLAFVLILATRTIRRSLAVATVVTAVPLGLFVVTSVNPSAWTVGGCLVAWAAAMTIADAQTPRSRWLAVGAYAFSATMAVSARGDALAFLVIVTAAAAVSHPRLRSFVWQQRTPVGVALLALIGLTVLVFTRVSQARVALGNPGTFQPGDFAASVTDRTYRNLVEAPSLLAGAFGTWPVGQIDTPMPTLVWFIVFGSFSALLIIGLGWSVRGKGLACGLIAVAFFAIPMFIYVRGGIFVGSAIQPRYMLPLVPAFLGIALFTTESSRDAHLTPRQRWVLTIGITIAHAVALHAVLQRYIVGTDEPGFNLNHHIEWWWSWMPSPMLTWILASVAFGYLAYRAFALFAEPNEVATPAASRAEVEAVPFSE